jgi:hypothetical protein
MGTQQVDPNNPGQYKVKLHVDIYVDLERVGDLLCTAFEGGSNYWYYIEKFIAPPKRDFVWDKSHLYRHVEYPLCEGGALMVSDAASGCQPELPKKGKRLDLPALRAGLELMAREYPKHFADFQAEQDDATTADVFLQCCMFGRLVYG